MCFQEVIDTQLQIESPHFLSGSLGDIFYLHTNKVLEYQHVIKKKSPQKQNLCFECKPMGMMMISQSAIKRSSHDLRCFPAKHIQDAIVGNGKPRVPAASTL